MWTEVRIIATRVNCDNVIIMALSWGQNHYPTICCTVVQLTIKPCTQPWLQPFVEDLPSPAEFCETIYHFAYHLLNHHKKYFFSLFSKIKNFKLTELITIAQICSKVNNDAMYFKIWNSLPHQLAKFNMQECLFQLPLVFCGSLKICTQALSYHMPKH